MAVLIDGNKIEDYIGLDAGISEWVEIPQGMINKFADLTGDHMFIHVDEEKAAQTPFGGTIAHGYLTLSLLPMFSLQIGLDVKGAYMGANYGLNKVRFIAPVRAGKRVRGHFSIGDIDKKAPGQLLITQQVTVEIEGEEKPALIADWLSMAWYKE